MEDGRLSGSGFRAGPLLPAPLDFTPAHFPDEALGSVLAIELGIRAGVAGFDALLAVGVLVLIAADQCRTVGVESAAGEIRLLWFGSGCSFGH